MSHRSPASKRITLEKAGLIRREVRGCALCPMEPSPLTGADAWLPLFGR